MPEVSRWTRSEMRDRSRPRRRWVSSRTNPAKVKVLRERFMAEHPEVLKWIAEAEKPVHRDNTFVHDVLAKLDRYGSLTDRQMAAIPTSLARDVEFAERRAREASETKGDAPDGKAEVTGKVVSIKWRESHWGATRKMLVKLTNNSKVWLTAAEEIEPGDTITVRATFTRSDDDRSFAFGKRPKLVEVIREGD